MTNTFSLDAVLRLRQHKEDAEERALSTLASHRQQVETTLGRVRQQVQRWAEERSRELGQLGTGSTQQGSYARLGMLREAETQLELQLTDLRQKTLEQQAAYLAARRAREVLSALQAEHQAEIKAASARKEQSRLEDLVLGRWPGQGRATRQKPGKDCRAD